MWVPGPGNSDLLAALSRSQTKFPTRKNRLFKAKSKSRRCPASMSPGIYLVAFPETMARAGGLMLTCCQEVPVEMPPLGVRGHLALH